MFITDIIAADDDGNISSQSVANLMLTITHRLHKSIAAQVLMMILQYYSELILNVSDVHINRGKFKIVTPSAL